MWVANVPQPARLKKWYFVAQFRGWTVSTDVSHNTHLWRATKFKCSEKKGETNTKMSSVFVDIFRKYVPHCYVHFSVSQGILPVPYSLIKVKLAHLPDAMWKWSSSTTNSVKNASSTYVEMQCQSGTKASQELTCRLQSNCRLNGPRNGQFVHAIPYFYSGKFYFQKPDVNFRQNGHRPNIHKKRVVESTKQVHRWMIQWWQKERTLFDYLRPNAISTHANTLIVIKRNLYVQVTSVTSSSSGRRTTRA